MTVVLLMLFLPPTPDAPIQGTDQIRAEIHSKGSTQALGCSRAGLRGAAHAAHRVEPWSWNSTTVGLSLDSRGAGDQGSLWAGAWAGPGGCKAGLAELEARLTWRFAGAMLAQTGVILAAVIGAAVAILRMLG